MVSDLISVADTAPPNQHLQTYAFAQLLRQGYIVANYLKVDLHKEIRHADQSGKYMENIPKGTTL